MLKRAVVRLLLFGVPFTFAYLVSRPALPTPPKPAFVICAYPDGRMKVAANAAACAAGSAILVPAAQRRPGPTVQGETADKTVHLPF